MSIAGPYMKESTNFIYNLLFCDNFELFKANAKPPHSYPFDILFSDGNTAGDLQKIIDDPSVETRIKALAYDQQRAIGYNPVPKQLQAVIVEVSMDEGLDTLASFKDGTARYINHTESMVVWETTDDEKANQLTVDLFEKSQQIVNMIGPWDKPRRESPAKDLTRISFVVSDGLYFGEGETNSFFNDPLAAPALSAATLLMQYLTEKTLKK